MGEYGGGTSLGRYERRPYPAPPGGQTLGTAWGGRRRAAFAALGALTTFKARCVRRPARTRQDAFSASARGDVAGDLFRHLFIPADLHGPHRRRLSEHEDEHSLASKPLGVLALKQRPPPAGGDERRSGADGKLGGPRARLDDRVRARGVKQAATGGYLFVEQARPDEQRAAGGKAEREGPVAPQPGGVALDEGFHRRGRRRQP